MHFGFYPKFNMNTDLKNKYIYIYNNFYFRTLNFILQASIKIK